MGGRLYVIDVDKILKFRDYNKNYCSQGFLRYIYAAWKLNEEKYAFEKVEAGKNVEYTLAVRILFSTR